MAVLHVLARFLSPPLRWDRLDRAAALRRRPASLSVLMLEGRLAPAVLTINSLADGPISAADSDLTLREAIVLIDTGGLATDAAGNSLVAAKSTQVDTTTPFGVNDIIQFAPSLFDSPDPQIVLEAGSLLLNRDVVVSVPNGTQLAVSGNNESAVLEIAPNAAVSISGIAIEAGAGFSGGGIINGGALTLIDTTVANNTALQGGGILNSGSLTLIGSAIADNTALNNGGIDNFGDLTLIDSTVSGNTATTANGGIANYGGSLVLIDSTITGNSAGVVGGLGNYSGGTATLLDSSVSGNSAAIAAGGIYNMATMTLSDSTVSGNAQTNGQGILNTGELTQVGTTVVDNTPIPGSAGGILNSGTMTIADSVVSGNQALNDGGIDNSGTLALTASTISGNTALGGNGGLANYGGAMTLVDSTISGNTAAGAGGLGNYDGGTMLLSNSIVTGNAAGFAGGILNAANLTLTDSTVADNVAFSGSGGGIFNTASLTLVNSTNAGNPGGNLENYGALTPIGGGTPANTVAVGNAADVGGLSIHATGNAPETADSILDLVTSTRAEITIPNNTDLLGSTANSEFATPSTLAYGSTVQSGVFTGNVIPLDVETTENCFSADSFRRNTSEPEAQARDCMQFLARALGSRFVAGSTNTDAISDSSARETRMDMAGTPGADTVVPAEESGDSAANLLPNAPGSVADRFDRGEIPIFKARWFGVFLLLPFLAIGDWLFERRSAQVQELLKSGKDQRTKDQNPRQGKS